jgi:hypothetical protein
MFDYWTYHRKYTQIEIFHTVINIDGKYLSFSHIGVRKIWCQQTDEISDLNSFERWSLIWWWTWMKIQRNASLKFYTINYFLYKNIIVFLRLACVLLANVYPLIIIKTNISTFEYMTKNIVMRVIMILNETMRHLVL